MYQAFILEDVLDLLQLGSLFPDLGARVGKWRGIAGKMLDWLLAMTHPDGGISFFNDAAEGMAGRISELKRYAARMGIYGKKEKGVRAMRRAGGSGYFRLEAGLATVIGDLAPLGPDHLPAHGHADIMSFEMSLGKQRIFVNGGTSEYGKGSRRQWERGTQAHNTVSLGHENSSELWGGFRVGRRSRITERWVEKRKARGEHDGYKHLPGSPRHRRGWHLSGHDLIVEDQIKPPHSEAVANFCLAPGLRLQGAAGRWVVLDQSKKVSEIKLLGGTGRAKKTQHAREFGRLESTECLVVKFHDGKLRTEVRW